MITQNFRDLPKVRDSLSYAYFDYGRIEQSKLGVEFVNDIGRIVIPIANLTTLMLGPGTTVTHAAINALAKSGCLVIWSGEEGVRFYAHGVGETRKGYGLQRQAALSSDQATRLRVVMKMYRLRFRESLPKNLTIEQLRGMEGVRVRDTYARAAKEYGVDWKGRSYDRSNWDNSDPVNRALSSANSCLNSICHAAIVSAGYSPGLGFIHQGTQLAFVYDIADLYKAALTIPLAFATAAENPTGMETVIRKRCREGFRHLKILQRIIPDIDRVLDIDSEDLPEGFDPDADIARPTAWWTPEESSITNQPEADDDGHDS
ncbi:MAG: type CRISPR-associated endonuclease Cas1 [Chlorobi bacterium]|nr:type CRISPR-associated endonuclease Cas1 [Chlorobiota bacterium]